MNQNLLYDLTECGRPDLAALLIELSNSVDEFRGAGERARLLNSYEAQLAAVLNAMIALQLRIADAKHRAGIGKGRADLERELRQTIPAACTRDMGIHELRAIATAVCHENGAKTDDSLHSDSPKRIAMRSASKLLGGLIGDNCTAPEETYTQSIQRFRGKFRGLAVFHFDPETMTFSVHAAADTLAGMQIGKRGRPPKNGN